ncbi:MAG TPA: XTP/dITP diphosphatase [Candidatus Bathyarchaeia archaeon]|nr:XTP/dITP diphosphatase [Candidatus Bathyarchaeia archaeon]
MRSRGEDATSQSDRKPLWFATENSHKFQEARTILSSYGIKVRQLRRRKTEIQSDNLEEIAKFAAKALSRNHEGRVLVEDSGLFIPTLKGFPGPYSSYIYKTLGLEGVLRLMDNSQDRKAYFQSTIAIRLEDGTSRTFSGRVYGTISRKVRGKSGFGFDPIFVPERESRTFGEMTQAVKNKCSHRARTFEEFAKWYLLPLAF